MIKILHINSSISVNSGVAGIIMNYYKHIDKSLIQFDFLYFLESENNFENQINEFGGHAYKIGNPKNILKFINELKEFMNKHKNEYDIVEIHVVYLAKLIYSTLKKSGIKKVILHAHATKWSEKKISAIRNKLMCINLKKYSDVFFACSDAAGKFVYGNDASFTIINNAIDTKRFKFSQIIRNQVRHDLHIEDKVVVGHVGRFCQQKNHIFLINIFLNILKKNPESILILIGEGPLQEEIISLVKENNIERNVIFLGNQKHVEIYYNAMDVFVLPSLYEGLPLVGVEAQINGLRCVMSKEITNEVNITDVSFLELKDDVDKWADLILRKASSPRIEDAISIVKRKGFSIDEETKKLENTYHNLLKN